MMFHKLLFVSWAFIGSIFAKSLSVCDQQSEWLGVNITTFQEPLTDNVSSYIFIDTPSQLSIDNTVCECAPMFGVVTYWMTNGTWTLDDASGDCILFCDRCQVYYCANEFHTDGFNNATNVTFDNTGVAICILPIDVSGTTTPPPPTTTTTTTTTTIQTEDVTDQISIEVEIHFNQGNTTSNYTLEYPVPTVTNNVTVPGVVSTSYVVSTTTS